MISSGRSALLIREPSIGVTPAHVVPREVRVSTSCFGQRHVGQTEQNDYCQLYRYWFEKLRAAQNLGLKR